MNPIKVMVTACGAPGSSTLIRHLKAVKEREIEVIGVDMDERASGRFLADRFHKILPASDRFYTAYLHDLVEKERPDVLLAVSSSEILKVSFLVKHLKKFGCKTIVNDWKTIVNVSDKHVLYKTLANANIPIPQYHTPDSFEAFKYNAVDLGHPKKPICFKPYEGKGSRGFRIIDESKDQYDYLMNHKPDGRYISMDEFQRIVGDNDFPEVLLCEFVEGTEYDCMVLANKDSDALLTTVKVREHSKYGLSDRGMMVKSPKHVDLCEKITKVLKLRYCNGIQFIDDKVIEVNLRPSTYIYDKSFNEPYLAIKMVLGEISDDEVRAYRDTIPVGMKFTRYMDQEFYK